MTDGLYINKNGILSLETEEDYDLESVLKLYLKYVDNLKLEIKYPNPDKLDSPFLSTNSYLKNIFIKVKPIDQDTYQNESLCQSILGLYPNLAFDPISKEYKVIVQGFAPNKSIFKQFALKIGDLILSINDIKINSQNIEQVLSAIKRPEKLKITALSPITYINLDTNDHILKTYGADILAKKERSAPIIALSKSTNVVKGDRVKQSNQPMTSDDLFMYAMILSLDQEALKRKQNLNEKNDLIYKYPSSESEFTFRKNENLLLGQLIEQIRGLFMTLGYVVKDINKEDQAICSLIEYQGLKLNVCFLNENYGSKGLLVILVPNNKIELDYFKVICKNLNHTFKFVFGSSFLSSLEDKNEKINLKIQLDSFFNSFHKRLTISSLFRLFNSTQIDTFYQDKLTTVNRIKIFVEMRTQYLDFIPFFELPYCLKNDIDSALSELEGQEFTDLEDDFYKFRRLFVVEGTCFFYQNTLLSTHLNESMTNNVYYFCLHYDLFNLIRNGNTNQFQIWKEVEIDNKPKNSRHFMIIVGFREFLAVMILESGGVLAREIPKNKIVEPMPIYIQKLSYMLLDLENNGVLNEIKKYFLLGTSDIIYNLDRFVKMTKHKKKTYTVKKRSNTKSPIRLQVDITRSRSRSIDNHNRNTQSKCSPSPNRAIIQDLNSIEIKLNDENKEEINMNDEEIYQCKKSNRFNSIGDLNRIGLNGKFSALELENRYFNDLSLNNSIIYYASSEGMTNGILFMPKRYNLNSSLFTRFFFNFVQSCFKIKNLFDNFKFIDNMKQFDKKNMNNYEHLEQGILFKLLIDDNLKSKNINLNNIKIDKSKMKELSFWVVGRRKFQQLSQNHKWNSLGDFFICFHDNMEDILIELAFDIGFSKLNF